MQCFICSIKCLKILLLLCPLQVFRIFSKTKNWSFLGSSDREEGPSPEKATTQRATNERKRKRKSAVSSHTDEGGGTNSKVRISDTKKINEYFKHQSNSPHRHQGAKSPSPQTHLTHHVSNSLSKYLLFHSNIFKTQNLCMKF